MATPDDLWGPMMQVESGGDPNAVGKAGEIGLVQIMPSTAADYGVPKEALYHPEVQRMLFNRIMGKYLDRYDGNATKAVAAWNAGMGAVDRGHIPASTQGYIQRVMHAIGSGVGATPAYAEEAPPAEAGQPEQQPPQDWQADPEEDAEAPPAPTGPLTQAPTTYLRGGPPVAPPIPAHAARIEQTPIGPMKPVGPPTGMPESMARKNVARIIGAPGISHAARKLLDRKPMIPPQALDTGMEPEEAPTWGQVGGALMPVIALGAGMAMIAATPEILATLGVAGMMTEAGLATAAGSVISDLLEFIYGYGMMPHAGKAIDTILDKAQSVMGNGFDKVLGEGNGQPLAQAVTNFFRLFPQYMVMPKRWPELFASLMEGPHMGNLLGGLTRDQLDNLAKTPDILPASEDIDEWLHTNIPWLSDVQERLAKYGRLPLGLALQLQRERKQQSMEEYIRTHRFRQPQQPVFEGGGIPETGTY